MNDPNLRLLEAAVELLKPLLDELVFIGGCTTGLLISDPAATGIRVTKDVDAIVELASYGEYAALSERLRGLGLNGGSHDLEDVIAVIDGRPEIVDEVRNASRDVRSSIASEIGRLLQVRRFVDALPGFLLPDAGSQARYPILRARLNALARPDA